MESENKTICILPDELIDEQQVMVKLLPKDIRNIKKISGCTLLGDGSIGLILDINGLVNY